MKSFRVKDLMINVSPCTACTLSCNAGPTAAPEKFCRPGCTNFTNCGPCTHQCTHQQCTNITCVGCTGCSGPCTHACTAECTGLCTYICTYVCTQAATPCHARFSCAIGVATVHPPEEEPQASLEALSTLRQQLQQQLAAVEQQEQAINAALKPQTVTQVDQLMQKLQEAMDELKTQRAELAKKEAQEKKQT